jgi:hypothetical protein
MEMEEFKDLIIILDISVIIAYILWSQTIALSLRMRDQMYMVKRQVK